MSRITGSDVYGLMEAYNTVYVPQELTEEQVWEEVENWVNSLLEEGYDLSEYTWEEMYEAYLSEMGQTRTTGQNSSGFTLPKTPSAGSAGGSGSGGRRGSGSSPSVRYSTPNPSFQQSGGFGRYGSPSSQVRTPAAPAARTPAGAPAAKPTSPAPATGSPISRPPRKPVSKPTQAKPTGPAIGMLGKTSFERRTPTSAELKGAQAARASGASPEQALQAAKSAGGALSQATAAASKPAAFSPSSSSAPAAAPKPNLQKSIRANRLNMSFDPFDVVMGHLLDEGYADTEDAALAIMANMSEEWRQSIVNEDLTNRQKYLIGKVGEMNKKEPGSAHKYTPGKQGYGAALDRANKSAMDMGV